MNCLREPCEAVIENGIMVEAIMSASEGTLCVNPAGGDRLAIGR